MMNWLSLPYECIRKARACPERPQGNPDGTDGTYVMYRIFGEKNMEQKSSAKVGATMKVLDNAKYIKFITTLALAVVTTYLY